MTNPRPRLRARARVVQGGISVGVSDDDPEPQAWLTLGVVGEIAATQSKRSDHVPDAGI